MKVAIEKINFGLMAVYRCPVAPVGNDLSSSLIDASDVAAGGFEPPTLGYE
jgi:hypothetical protein